MAWALLRRHRRRATDQLGDAFPSWDRRTVGRTVRGVFRWVGRTGADFLHMGGRDQARMLASIRVEGQRHLDHARRQGRGIVVVTGHLGNWELLGSWLAAEGTPFRVLYHPFREERLDRFVQSRRRRGGVAGIPAAGTAVAALRALRRGEWVGLLIDRVPRGTAVSCRFFGQECRTAPGAAWLASRAGALVLPVAMWHDARGGYRLRFEPPLDGATKEGEPVEVATVALTRRLTAILEDQIREVPEQWPWFHDRWKRRAGPLLGDPVP